MISDKVSSGDASSTSSSTKGRVEAVRARSIRLRRTSDKRFNDRPTALSVFRLTTNRKFRSLGTEAKSVDETKSFERSNGSRFRRTSRGVGSFARQRDGKKGTESSEYSRYPNTRRFYIGRGSVSLLFVHENTLRDFVPLSRAQPAPRATEETRNPGKSRDQKPRSANSSHGARAPLEPRVRCFLMNAAYCPATSA